MSLYELAEHARLRIPLRHPLPEKLSFIEVTPRDGYFLTEEDYWVIDQLFDRGLSPSAIARRIRCDPLTVRNYLKSVQGATVPDLRRKLTPEVEARLRPLVAEGLDHREIAKRLQIQQVTALRWLKRLALAPA
jgi:DNA-binding NarL/FixJ family response regulator